VKSVMNLRVPLKKPGNYWEATQLLASRVVLSSTGIDSYSWNNRCFILNSPSILFLRNREYNKGKAYFFEIHKLRKSKIFLRLNN
jgi:hypothetical protein